MSDLDTAREAFFVQVVGEMAQVTRRIEAATALLGDSEHGLREARDSLTAVLTQTEERLAAAAERAKTVALKHIAVKVDAVARGAAYEQVRLMEAAARDLFRQQFEPLIQHQTVTLQKLLTRAQSKSGRWESLLTHAAAASTGCSDPARALVLSVDGATVEPCEHFTGVLGLQAARLRVWRVDEVAI